MYPKSDRTYFHLRYGDTMPLRLRARALRDALATPKLRRLVREHGLLVTEAADMIDSIVPRVPAETWARIAPFVRDAVTVAVPRTAYSAEILMWAAGQYVAWCVDERLWPLQAEVIWSRQAIDLYVNDEHLNLTDGTRRNYRARLMRISEVLVPEEHGEQMTPLNRKTTSLPYTAGEMERFRHWAGAQRSAHKRYRAMLMLIVCGGAGLRPSEVGVLTREDVIELPGGGYALRVDGEPERVVPVLAEWDDWFESALEHAPEEGNLWGRPNRTRVTTLLSGFTQTCTGNSPRADRLRATWLVAHLVGGTPIKELFRAAGVVKFEHLGRLLRYVPDADTGTATSALRGVASLPERGVAS